MPVLVAQIAISNADYFVIAGLPVVVNHIIKDFIRKEFMGFHWTLHVDTFDWHPLLPHLPSLNWMDRIAYADHVRDQELSALKITARCEMFAYRDGWLNRRYGYFHLIN